MLVNIPGAYVTDHGEVWIATHYDGEPCERAVTTHDCPRGHKYEPLPDPMVELQHVASGKEEP